MYRTPNKKKKVSYKKKTLNQYDYVTASKDAVRVEGYNSIILHRVRTVRNVLPHI